MSDEQRPRARAVGQPRVENDRERRLREFFDDQEIKSVDNLEAGARQIIQLVTALFGVVFGVLALGGENFAAALQTPLVFFAGLVAVVALAIAIVAALAVVLPSRRSLRANVPADEEATFNAMLEHKRNWLSGAAVAYGVGLIALAVLVAKMLWLWFVA